MGKIHNIGVLHVSGITEPLENFHQRRIVCYLPFVVDARANVDMAPILMIDRLACLEDR